MVFNSYTFVLFFFTVLATQRISFSWSLKKRILLVSSYFFYAAWNPPFVILLWISTLIDWWAARSIYRYRNSKIKKIFFSISLCANLGLLGFFKYSEFLLDNFAVLLELFDIRWVVPEPDIVLPVGISFYTFQTLSYTFDIYRGKERPWPSFLDYALYVAFFPQLVAGPIVRAFDFLPQCLKYKKVASEEMSWGLSLLILGLFEKMVLADGIFAPVVNAVYAAGSVPGFWSAWIGTLAFAGQIFCDFAGYSTCAIGVGKCLGFELPVNFRFPYAAIGFRDFWRRWHITLSTWLRDYLYISLGGSRKGAARTRVNIMATMLVGGLWHGASWTFVAWGCFHGLLIIAERFFLAVVWKNLKFVRQFPVVIARIIAGLFTFAMVSFGWVFFRSQDFAQAFGMVKTMLGSGIAQKDRVLSELDGGISIGVMVLILVIHWLMRDRSLKSLSETSPWWARSMCLGTLLAAIAVFSGEDRAFIYFQF